MQTDRVAFEEAAEGFKVHGLTELNIELAIFELQKQFPQIRQQKPQVAYRMGPPFLEPYYRATIDVPEDCADVVIGDVSGRRGLLERALESPTGKRVIAAVPVSECFGYATVLRILTKGRGSYSVEFLGYRRVGGDDAA